ncbi:MAG: ABC transporter substrate-binding protein [Syntrophales bacterium]|nr:ABC transporter substrate-binding protein [Syntrophales bacterium]
MKKIILKGFIFSFFILFLLPIYVNAKDNFKLKVAVSQSYTLLPLYVGLKLGYYEGEGIEIEPIEMAGGGDTVRGVTTGGMHMGVVGLPSPVIAYEKGETVKVVGGMFATPSMCWVVKIDSPIKTIQDLKGKKAAYARPGGNAHFLLIKSLKEAKGIDPEDVTLVSTGGSAETITALKTGLVDAAYSAEPNVSKYDKEFRVLWRLSEYVPDYVEFVFMTSNKFIKEHPDIISKFLKAHQKANDFIIKNPEEAGKIWAEALNIPNEIGIRALRNSPLKRFTTRLPIKGLEAAEEELLEFKLIKKPVDWKGLIDQNFLAKELRIEIP